MSKPVKKRTRNDPTSGPRKDGPGGLSLETTRVRPQETEISESDVLEQLSDLKTEIPLDSDSVYLKMVVGISEASYIESKQEEISGLLSEKFGIKYLSVGKPSAGTDVTLITLNGSIDSITKAAIYISFLEGSKLNSLSDTDSFIKKSAYSITFVLGELLSDGQLQRIEAASDESRLDSYDICVPDYFSADVSLTTIRIRGTFESIYGFLISCISMSTSSQKYIDDSKVPQVPFISADDVHLYETQSINKDLLVKSNEDMIEYLFDKSTVTDVL